MKEEYIVPEIEFIDIDDSDVLTASECDGYVCPESYGTTCSGNPYGGA